MKVSREVKKMEEQGPQLLHQANAIEVKDDEGQKLAAEFQIGIRTRIKAVQAEADLVIIPARKTLEASRNFFKKILGPFQVADDHIGKEMGRYSMERQRKIDAENRRLAEEARKKEEAQQARMKKKAEKLREKGREGEAALIEEEAETFFQPIPQVTQPDNTMVAGGGKVSMRKDIKVSIEDMLTFIGAVLEGKAPMAAVEIKLGRIKQWAKEQGLKEGVHYGVKVERVMGTQVRV